MFGGIDTTEGMIANAVLHLLATRTQLDLVRADPALLAAAIEESVGWSRPPRSSTAMPPAT